MPTVAFPIVYGSAAFKLERPADDGATYRWYFYVRGVGGQDVSPVVSKVVFMLHPTCAVPTPECTAYPFETTQTGWGEFNAAIDIHFALPGQPKITVLHSLRFYPEGASTPVLPNGPVVSETYDEVVFRDPPADFTERLRRVLASAPMPHILSKFWTPSFDEAAHLEAVNKAHAWVKRECARLQVEMARVAEQVDKVKRLKGEAAAVGKGAQPQPQPQPVVVGGGSSVPGPSSYVSL